LIVNKDGAPKPLLANAITALRLAPEWQGVLAFNEFSELIEAVKPPPWPSGRAGVWCDDYDRRVADWLQHRGIYVSTAVAGQAVETVAMEGRFHPVRNYLKGLVWDGNSRLDDWLARYLGVQPSKYTCAVGARWLISAVARIYRPGVKADHCLILEGPQGAKKSTALRVLAEPWFTDEISDLGTKDASLQTRGVWVIEMSELDAMRRSDLAKVKAFISRSADRFRPPYGKRLIESPRQCVFAATTNQDTYLQDETGGRRFWPVRCGTIHIDLLKRDRDQLWAEAVERFNRGDVWWLDNQELNAAAVEEQADRYEGDPWEPMIRQWVSNRESVTVADILGHAIGRPLELWTQNDKIRVARCLRALRWERYRARSEGGLEWRYRRK
jgi:predicted P-loop ATPase